LPTLTNEGAASDLLQGKQLIDQNGNIVTGNIKSLAAKTVTPITQGEFVAAAGSCYAAGDIIVKGDSNLIPSNIKSGVSIFGVNGTYDGSIGDEVETEMWTFTLEDGSTVEKEIVKYYSVGYTLDTPITSSNTATKIRSGEDYVTVLSSGDELNGYYFDSVFVWLSGEINENGESIANTIDFFPDENFPWLVYLTIPASEMIGYNDIAIVATLSSNGWSDEEDG
jgi:hypothetical protein